MEETMWIPIEAVKYVEDDTRRLSKDVSRYFRYEGHREKYGAENWRTARALVADAYKHKTGVSKTWREDQIKCDSGAARSARKCAVHTCNPRAQWTSRVGPHILHIEENTVHVDFFVHAGARRTTADPVSKEAFMQEEPATDGEVTLATSRPRTSWKSHCKISQRFPATSPRWSIIHTGRKAYFENRATSRFVILSNRQQRDCPRKYDAIICRGEKMKMKEHWETEMLFDMKNTTNEDSQEKVSIQHQKCISADKDMLNTTKKTKAV